MKLTAQTKSGLKAEIIFKIKRFHKGFSADYIAKTKKGELSVGIRKGMKKGKVTKEYYVSISSAAKLWDGMPNKSGLLYIVEQDMVEEFEKAAKEAAYNAEQARIENETVLLNDLYKNDIISVVFASGTYSLLCSIDIEGKELNPVEKEKIEKYLVTAKRKKLISGILDPDYTYREKLNLNVEEIKDIIDKIDNDKNEAKKEKAQKFEQARQTGKPVLLHKTVLPESETPLKNDGEGDMVDVLTLAMPDGSTKKDYQHNY